MKSSTPLHPPAAEPEAKDRAPRAPQQERGQRRVEQILDAAEQAFVEHGAAGATMQLIADRANASVGSLYHFFPNKEAIVEALGARYADAVRDTNMRAMPLALAHLPAEQLFDRILRAQVEFIAATPAFDTVHEAVQRNCPAINDALNQALVGHVGQFMALRYPTMPEHERAASAMVSVATVHSVVDLSCRLPLEFREPVIRETHTMLVAHYSGLDAKFGANAAR